MVPVTRLRCMIGDPFLEFNFLHKKSSEDALRMRDPFSPALPFPYLTDAFVARITSIKSFTYALRGPRSFNNGKDR
jgi:hypothetical protein